MLLAVDVALGDLAHQDPDGLLFLDTPSPNESTQQSSGTEQSVVLLPVLALTNHAAGEVELHVVRELPLLGFLNLFTALGGKRPELGCPRIQDEVRVIGLEASARLVDTRLINLKVVLLVEVVLESTEVIAVPLWIGYTDECLEPVTRWRNPTGIDVIVSSQYRLGFLNVDVIEVQYNKSAVIEQTLVTAVRELTAKADNRELLLCVFVAITNRLNRGFRLALPNPSKGSMDIYMVRTVLVVQVLEEGYFHCIRFLR